jgi:hypothetical protein
MVLTVLLAGVVLMLALVLLVLECLRVWLIDGVDFVAAHAEDFE